jgi:hypothetical protein
MRKLLIILWLIVGSLTVNAQLVKTSVVYAPLVSGGGVCNQNLLKYSEQLDNAVWTAVNMDITANQEVDLDGNTTMEEVSVWGASEGLYYNDGGTYVAVTAGETYRLTFDVKRGTMSEMNWSVYDNQNDADIVAPTSYYSQTSSSEVRRLELEFTIPSGCTSVRVFLLRNSGVDGNVTAYFGRVQIEEMDHAILKLPMQ